MVLFSEINSKAKGPVLSLTAFLILIRLGLQVDQMSIEDVGNRVLRCYAFDETPESEVIVGSSPNEEYDGDTGNREHQSRLSKESPYAPYRPYLWL
jgi:hypothetical protein